MLKMDSELRLNYMMLKAMVDPQIGNVPLNSYIKALTIWLVIWLRGFTW